MPLLFVWMFLIFLLPVSCQADSFFQTPVLSISKDSGEFKDLIGKRGSQLCAPISIAQAVALAGGTASVRDLFNSCGTDREHGTHYRAAHACLTEAVHRVGASSLMVGPHAAFAPVGESLANDRHVVTKHDLVSAMKTGIALVAAVGWYDEDPSTHVFKRVGGHFVNVYGLSDEIGFTLRVGNSLRDYSGRPVSMSYDVVTARETDESPVETKVEIVGPGFEFRQRTFVEDLFEVIASK